MTIRPRNARRPLRVTILAVLTIASCKTLPVGPDVPLHIYAAADGPQRIDPNGFLLNPAWHGGKRLPPDIEEDCRFRVATRLLEQRDLYTTRPGCLSKEERAIVSLNEATNALGLGVVCVTGGKTGRVRGHVNWFPVTVTGQLIWNSFSGGLGDHDINIDLVPPDTNAVTSGNAQFFAYNNRRAYHLESFYDETLGLLKGSYDSFWRALSDVHEDEGAAHGLIDHRFAIITGVYGLDAVHGFHAELHPALAMSILVDTSTVDGKLREEWALMLRNQGGEGDCAEGMLPLLTRSISDHTQEFSIDLGAWQNAQAPSVKLGPGSQATGGYFPTAHVTQSGGASRVYLRFEYPRPTPAGSSFLFLGTIFVDWPHPDRTTWENRFKPWLPGAGPPMQLARVSTLGAVPPNAGTSLPDGGLPSPQVLVEKTPPWPLPGEAKPLDCAYVDKSNLLCFSPARWVAASTIADGLYFPVVSRFRYPHSSYFVGESALLTTVNVLYGLGDRWDFRMDRLHPKEGTKDFGQEPDSRCLSPVYPAADARCGGSVRWNPYVSPNTIRLTDWLIIVPYTVGHLGISLIDRPHETLNHGFGFTTGGGLGFQLQLGRHELFWERQFNTRSWYRDQWITTIGWLTPFFRD